MGKSIRNIAAVTRVGLDLAKKVFQVHAVDARGEMVVARKVGARPARSPSLPSWCRAWWRWRPAPRPITGGGNCLALGHEVKLIPRAHVKPYVRRNKNDAADAAAICEAAGRPGQRFVSVRSIDNQAELMRHRARSSSPASAPRCLTPCAGTWPRSASSQRRGRNMLMT